MNRKLFLLIGVFSVTLIVANFTMAQETHNAHMNEVPTEELTQPTIKLSIKKIIQEHDKQNVLIGLKNINDDTPVTLNDLQEVHTQKIHLMIIDETLEDYIHLHPEPTDELGVYKFTWHPNTTGNYKIWADLFPLKSLRQEYISAMLLSSQQASNPLSKMLSYKSKIDNFTFKLSFDQTNLKINSSVIGEINVSDAKGNPVKNLQPVMGAFAHIVGFTEDFNHMVHLHPLGAEPTKDSDRGGPVLQFHFEPKTPGFIKLFAQVHIQGKEIYVPFGVKVDR